MNRDTFRQLKGNETVNVNSQWKGSTSGRQGTVVKIQDKAKGVVRVKFLERKTPTDYNYRYLDLVEEEGSKPIESEATENTEPTTAAIEENEEGQATNEPSDNEPKVEG